MEDPLEAVCEILSHRPSFRFYTIHYYYIPNTQLVKGRKGDGASESRHATALRGARSRFQRPHHLQLSRSMLIRNIIVVKLIKSVIANPADRKEGLRPLSPPYNEKIISIYDDRIVKRTGSENDFGLRVAQYSLIRITKK